jgi:hypothetical protein
MLAHFAREVRQDLVLVVESNPEHGTGEHGRNGALKFNWLFVCQAYL